MGINPDIIVLRCDEPLERRASSAKIALFCNVKPDCVIENLTLPVLYEAPLMLEKSEFLRDCLPRAGHRRADARPDASGTHMLERIADRSEDGDHRAWSANMSQLHDAYLSVAEALRHARLCATARMSKSTGSIPRQLTDRKRRRNLLGRLRRHHRPRRLRRPRHRGHDRWPRSTAREHNVPYFGICLGMQIAVIEFARHVCGFADANSGEFDPACAHKVIDFMPDQSDEIDKGGTLRLGAYPCEICTGHAMDACLRRDRDLRAAPPPLRVQQRVPRSAGRCRARASAAPRRTADIVETVERARQPLLRRRAVPPRVQEPPQQGAPPLPRSRRRRSCKKRTGIKA